MLGFLAQLGKMLMWPKVQSFIWSPGLRNTKAEPFVMVGNTNWQVRNHGLGRSRAAG
jgi:hypothetical protein